MSRLRSSLADRPVAAGLAILLLAMVGSGVGITAALKLRDRDAVASAPVTAAVVRGATPASVDLADMVANVVPSVVQVQVTGLRRHAPGVISPNGGDNLRRFYDDGPQNNEDSADAVLGSGFIVDAKGLVVTNAHVVEGGSKIRVRLASGREVGAELVGVDSKTDLAVLRIAGGAGLPAVNWGDSDKVRVGETIFAVGSPFGLGSTVTSGIVSGRGREIGEGPYDDFLQIDAAINQGNSGGPLFDRFGHVIGVNTAIYSPSDSGGNVGIGFAIPAHMVQQVVRQLVANGHVIRGQIGISIQPVTDDIAESMGLKEAHGALVAGVTADSPAARGGVRIGDVITRFGGAPVTNARDLTRLVAESTIGEVRVIEVLRDGKPVVLKVAAMSAERPTLTAAPVAARVAGIGSTDLLGLVVTRTTPELNTRAEQPVRATGVMVTHVDPTSGGFDRGLEVGDLIIAANHLRVDTPDQLKAGVASANRAGRRNILLEVLRGEEHAFVAVPLS